jgi:ABC-type multidrug transport system ATPase subunit
MFNSSSFDQNLTQTIAQMNDSNKLAIAWIDLKFTIKPFLLGEEKVILNQICGGFEFSSINALMDGSGSGKTTLLKCLNGKSKSGLSERIKSNLFIYLLILMF